MCLHTEIVFTPSCIVFRVCHHFCLLTIVFSIPPPLTSVPTTPNIQTKHPNLLMTQKVSIPRQTTVANISPNVSELHEMSVGNHYFHSSTSYPFHNDPDSTSDFALPLAASVPLAIIMIITIFISALGNSIVCLIVYRKPAMRSAINLLLANLAFADIMVAICCMPFALITVIKRTWIFDLFICKLTAFLNTFFAMGAVFTLATISVDRYFIIVRRKDKLNPLLAKHLICISWCCGLMVAFPPIIGWGKYGHSDGQPHCQVQRPETLLEKTYVVLSLVAVFFLPFIAMLFSYVFILNTVRRNSMRVENHPKSLSISQASKLGLAGLNHRPSRVHVDMSFKTRAFTTILLLFIVFVFCWAPYSIASMYVSFSSSAKPGINSILWACLLWLTYLNSAFNPIIYCWRIKKFREACCELLPKSFKILPHLPGRARRRIRPGAMYECNAAEQSSTV